MLTRDSSSSLPGLDQQQTVGTVTGNKELLWSRLRDAASLQGLLALAEDAGFHPVVLPKRTLLREGVTEADFGAILGQLGVFGAILDCKTASESMQRELVRRELNLVKLGLTKHSINLLLHHLQLARNLGMAACLVIDDCAPPATTVRSVFEPLQESRHLLASGLPTVIFGCSDAGTVTRIEDREDPAPATGADDSSEQQLTETDHAAGAAAAAECDCDSELLLQRKRCSFTDMMLVAYETSCRAAA